MVVRSQDPPQYEYVPPLNRGLFGPPHLVLYPHAPSPSASRGTGWVLRRPRHRSGERPAPRLRRWPNVTNLRRELQSAGLPVQTAEVHVRAEGGAQAETETCRQTTGRLRGSPTSRSATSTRPAGQDEGRRRLAGVLLGVFQPAAHRDRCPRRALATRRLPDAATGQGPHVGRVPGTHGDGPNPIAGAVKKAQNWLLGPVSRRGLFYLTKYLLLI
jgi:hypothetical protein